jgi:hypothetical protein
MKRIVATIFACISLSLFSSEALQASDSANKILQEQYQLKSHVKRGPRGHRGHRGHKGHHGKRGVQGVAGPQGIQGPIGQQGPTGASVAPSYIEAYIDTGSADTPPPVPQIPSVLKFNETGPSTSDITYDSSTGFFTINTDGIYTFEYGARSSTPHTETSSSPIYMMLLSISVNGTTFGETQALASSPTLETEHSSYVGTSNQITLPIDAGTVVQFIVGVFPASGEDLFTPQWGVPGGETTEIAAYLSIEKIDQ